MRACFTRIRPGHLVIIMCQFCELFIRKTGETFSIGLSKDDKPIKISEAMPEDSRVFTFALRSQAREWYHRRQWEKILFGSSKDHFKQDGEERGWTEFRSEIRESIDSKKSEIERLLNSPIIKNVSRGLEMHGFKITPSKEVFAEPASDSPLCGSGGKTSEGVERATDIIAIFELYLERVHAQEIKTTPPGEEKREDGNLTTNEASILEEIERVIKAADELRSRALLVTEGNPQLNA